MIKVTRDDALGAFIRLLNRQIARASSNSWSGACVPAAASGGSTLTVAGASFSSCITRHPSHEVMLIIDIIYKRPSCASSVQASTRLAPLHASIQATFSHKMYVSQGMPRYPKLHHALEVAVCAHRHAGFIPVLSPAPCSAARRRTLTRVRRHDLPAPANTAGHWLVGTVLASALCGVARRSQSSVKRRRLARYFQHDKSESSPGSRSIGGVLDPKVRSTAARRRLPN
jgi:hypothetical protein